MLEQAGGLPCVAVMHVVGCACMVETTVSACVRLCPGPYGIHSVDAQVECSLLRELHPHVRDIRLRFQAESHTYLIDGKPTLGSLA